MSQPYRPSSRLAKKEKQKLQRQTAFYIVAGVASLLLFIFVLMPLIIRGFFALIDREDPAASERSGVPPQVPVLAATPPEATSSGSLLLEGFASADSKVVFVLNAREAAQTRVNEEGAFSQAIVLDEGDNELVIYGVNDQGQESLKTRSYAILFDLTPPPIELEYPQDGEVVEFRRNQTITIKGQTEPEARVFINDRFVWADQEGLFSANYHLSEGKNTIQLRAIDKALNESEKTIEVEFRL